MKMTTFEVQDSLCSADGSNGWSCGDYGPFDTEQAAEAFARRLASEGYVAGNDEFRLVQVSQNGCNYGVEPRLSLYSWRSSDDDENTTHTLGPSDEEKHSLRIRAEEEVESE
jgi:hypothetical protein